MTVRQAWTLWRAKPRQPAPLRFGRTSCSSSRARTRCSCRFSKNGFPHLVRKYREQYDRAAYLRGSYPEMIQERVEAIRKRHGLDRKSDSPEPEFWPHDPQIPLFDAVVLV